ncbi:MAG: hypothetical protein ACOY4T_14475, partial [Pseudomonadota bacterium]
MKPSFALSLSQDGITLYHRTTAGWMRVGEVDPEAPGLADSMRFLRSTVLGLAPQGFQTKLILPGTQILYLEIEAPGPDRASRRAQIAKALDGRTPYAVSDLVFDWSGEGPTVRVAVVARLTLDEAEAFAEEHRFHPVCFVSAPREDQFDGEPYFGSTGRMLAYLPLGERLERDSEPVRPVGRAREPDAGAAEDRPGPDDPELGAPFVAVDEDWPLDDWPGAAGSVMAPEEGAPGGTAIPGGAAAAGTAPDTAPADTGAGGAGGRDEARLSPVGIAAAAVSGRAPAEPDAPASDRGTGGAAGAEAPAGSDALAAEGAATDPAG